MLFSLKQNPNRKLELIGYKKIDVLAVYPVAITRESPEENGYGIWVKKLLLLEALVIADGELTKMSWNSDVTFEDSDSEYVLGSTGEVNPSPSVVE